MVIALFPSLWSPDCKHLNPDYILLSVALCRMVEITMTKDLVVEKITQYARGNPPTHVWLLSCPLNRVFSHWRFTCATLLDVRSEQGNDNDSRMLKRVHDHEWQQCIQMHYAREGRRNCFVPWRKLSCLAILAMNCVISMVIIFGMLINQTEYVCVLSCFLYTCSTSLCPVCWHWNPVFVYHRSMRPSLRDGRGCICSYKYVGWSGPSFGFFEYVVHCQPIRLSCAHSRFRWSLLSVLKLLLFVSNKTDHGYINMCLWNGVSICVCQI